MEESVKFFSAYEQMDSQAYEKPSVYKFKDKIDGNYCFVLAKSENEAKVKVESVTSLPVDLIRVVPVRDLKPIIIYNNILPF